MSESAKQRLIENINATMLIEDMPLTEEDKKRIKKYLDNRDCFKEILNKLIIKHTIKVGV